MKHKSITPLTVAACLLLLLSGSVQAQRERYNLQTYREQAPKREASDWMFNVGVGYGTYYGDMSNYTIRRFEDIGLLRNFLNYNKNYVNEPSFHVSVAKRLGTSSSGIGFNLNRTLIQSSDRYLRNDGTIDYSSPTFARSLNFKTDILDAGLSFNFNGFTTGFFAPYLSVGGGISHFTVKGDVFQGQNQNVVYDYNNTRNVNDGIFETNLRDAQTETDTKYPNTVFYAQALLGFNFQLSKTFSLALESDVRYSGSDYLDDLSGRYKTTYPSLRSAYIARPGYNIPNANADRGRNDGINDFYIQNRIVFRFHLPKYLKKSELRKIETKFNGPILYPSNYETTPLDSSAYQKAMDKMKMGDSVRMGKMKDSLAMVRKDSLQADSLMKARTYNVKMDTAYTNEIKALRIEIANLRQTIGGATVKAKDSLAQRRATLKDSLSSSIQKLQQKKKKTANDSLQLQINRLRIDSINVEEKASLRKDSLQAATSANAGVATTKNAVVPATSTSANLSANYKAQDDSLRRMIDSLKLLNGRTNATTQTQVNAKVNTPNRNIRNIKDTISTQNAQQYQQQIAGLAYRSQQAGLTDAQRKSKQDSIAQLSTSLRASDSLRVAYYQTQLAKAQQQEENLHTNEKRGLLVKKTDAAKKAEQNTADAQAALLAAQTTQRTNLQNASVATGDTSYITNLRRQYNARQVEIDSLKSNKRALDIFSNKNRRIKELEDQQKTQQQQIEDANKQLQYYRNVGPTSYMQPQYYPQQVIQQPNYSQQFDDYNRRIEQIEKQRLALAALSVAQQPLLQQPVNSASPVVVSTNNVDTGYTARLQSQIDSLRNEVARMRNPNAARLDTVVRRAPVDSTLQKSLDVANQNFNDMASIQRQLAELNNRLNNRPATTATPPATTSGASATVYFTRGSAVLATLQKAKLASFVKKHKKTDNYELKASSDNTTGNTEANAALARRRAEAVQAYLKVQGVPAANTNIVVDANDGTPGGTPNPLAKKVEVRIQ